MWDEEVDIAIIGAGIGGLVNAIATVDAGGEVLVADAAPAYRGALASVALRERLETTRSWLPREIADVETNEFLAAVSEGVSESDVLRRHAGSSPRRAQSVA